MKTQEQKNKLTQLYKDVFDTKKDIMETLKTNGFKIITKFSEITTTSNICYFNYRTNEVDAYVHKKLVKKPSSSVNINSTNYWKTLDLTCKKHHKEKGKKLFVNYSYNLTSVSDKMFTVVDQVEGTSLTLPTSKMNHFSLPYANTCHSVQGLLTGCAYHNFRF